MRTPLGARRGVQLSPVPIPAWAEAIGIGRSSMRYLVQGTHGMTAGPAMARLIQLFDRLDRGEATWERQRWPNGKPRWVLRSRESFTPASTYHVNFLRGTLDQPHAVSG